MSVFILKARRTPIGSFGGIFKDLKASYLGVQAAKPCVRGLEKDISSVIVGQVLSANEGQAPAKQVCLGLKLPTSIPCFSVNKVCSSGLKAVLLGADEIRLKRSSLVLCGGQESMSQAPHLTSQLRWGHKLGSLKLIDSILKDGLEDAREGFHMGEAADWAAKKFEITREDQDDYARHSYERALKASSQGWFQKETSPVSLSLKGVKIEVKEDESLKKLKREKIAQLKPAFTQDGTVTAANASSLNDGASFLVLSSQSYLEQSHLEPLCELIDQSIFSSDPKDFVSAPVYSIQKLLKQNNLKVQDIDLWEINEAFSLVPCIAEKKLKIPRERLNVHGGAVSLGHPIGASGARILTSLIYALKRYQKSLGICSICLGGGEALSVLIKNKT